MRLLALLAVASLAFADPPSAATKGEISAYAAKNIEQLTAELNFQQAQISALKAQITRYEELLAAPALKANKDAGALLKSLQAQHNAGGCDLDAAGEWKCAPAKK